MVESAWIEVNSTHPSVYMGQQIIIFVIETLWEKNYGFPFTVLEQCSIEQFVPYSTGHAVAPIQEVM